MIRWFWLQIWNQRPRISLGAYLELSRSLNKKKNMFALPYREIQGKIFHLLFLEAKIKLSSNELMTLLVDRGRLRTLLTGKKNDPARASNGREKKQRALPGTRKLLEQHLHFFTKIYLFCSQIANNAQNEKLDEQLRPKKWSNLAPVASADRTEARGVSI